MKIILSFLLILLSPWGAHAVDKCTTLFSVFQKSEADLDQGQDVIDAIKKLNPYFLDYSNLQKSIDSLLNDISSLRDPHARIRDIEKALDNGQVDPWVAQTLVESLGRRLSDDARQILTEQNSSLPPVRKALEGYRLLLSKLQKLSQKAKELAKEPQDAEEPSLPTKEPVERRQQPPTGKKSLGLDELAQEMAEQLSQQKQRPVDRDDVDTLSEQDVRDLQEQTAQKIMEQLKNSEDLPSDQTQSKDTPLSENREARDALEERLQKMADEAQERNREQNSKPPEPAGETKEPTNTTTPPRSLFEEAYKKALEEWNDKNSEKSETQEENKNDSKPQEGQGEPKPQEGQGEGKPQEGQGEGKPQEGQGEPKPQEGQGDGRIQGNKPQEGKTDEAPPDGKGERRESNGLGAEETRSQNGSQKDGSDGQNEGGATGFKDLMGELSAFLEQLKTNQKERINSAEEFSKIDREKLESLAENTKNDKSKPESGEKPKDRKKEDRKSPKKPDLVRNLDQLLDSIWSQILNQYQNSSQFMRMVTDFSSLCQSLAVNNPHQAHILQQKIARANELADKLRLLAVEYKDIEDLATSLSSGSAKVEFLRRIRYLKTLFEAKNDANNLESGEERALQTINEILNQLEASLGSTNNEAIGETFRDLLAGPLSRKVVDENYPPTSRSQQIDATKLVQDLKNGKLNDLVVYNRLKPFVDILFNDLFKPRSFDKFEGPYIPINESDRKLEKLEDFDDIVHAVKEGFSSDLELIRLLAGDMLKFAYPEKIKKMDPRKPYPKRASIVLYDISGSMTLQNKQDLRNALVNAFLDRSQREVAQGEGEHTVYLIPFDARPHEPKVLTSLAQAQQFFDDLRAHPLGSSGDDSITQGMVKAYELIAEHQKNGGDLERANILLLTDAIAKIDFAQLEEAASKIDSSVDLALNAVTFGDWNADVSKMVNKYAVNSEGNVGKVSHQHIPYEEIQRLLNPKNEIEELIQSAKYFDKTNTSIVSDLLVDRARGRMMAIANERSSRDRNAGMRLERWAHQLKALALSTETNDLTPMYDLFVDTVVGATGKNWSRFGKLEAWENFIDIAGTQTELSQKDLLSYLSVNQRDRILKWMTE